MKLKSLLAVFLCLVLLCTAALPAEALLPPVDPYTAVNGEPADDPTPADDPNETPGENPGEDPGEDPPVVDPPADGIVARMYLCHRWSKFPSLGHVWVYVENLTAQEMQIGAYTVPAYEGVSLGCFGLTRSDGGGTYYNVEAHCGNKYGVSGMIALKQDLNAAQVARVSKAACRRNWWDPFNNCVFYAVGVWNAGGGRFVLPFIFPTVVKWQILAADHVNEIQMTDIPADRVFKQIGTGSSATLRVCQEGSLDSQIG